MTLYRNTYASSALCFESDSLNIKLMGLGSYLQYKQDWIDISNLHKRLSFFLHSNESADTFPSKRIKLKIVSLYVKIVPAKCLSQNT